MRGQVSARFNVLLTQRRPHAQEHWSHQLGLLLEPQGVVAHLASTAREALCLAEQYEMHAAVIDLATPMDPVAAAAGTTLPYWLLELAKRLHRKPPVILLHPPALTQRDVDRLLHEALRLGVFSVLHEPVSLEQLLRVFQRLVEQRYRGAWPAMKPPAEDDGPEHLLN
ncbi:MAG: hypothetical protein IT440_14460 [Phycisphaeraceae bacterium]|nr:hypothetical protein [Phycisphaeraceae bacterium]